MITDSHRTVERTCDRVRAHGPDQAELARALVHREAERVGDAEGGDEHGQDEQPVEEVDDLVDLRRLIVDVLRPGSAPWRSGYGCTTCSMAASASASETPGFFLTKTEKSNWSAPLWAYRPCETVNGPASSSFL